MKKYSLIMAAMFLSIYIFGCGKKNVPSPEAQEPMSMEALSTLSSNATTTPETKPQVATPPSVSETKLEPLPSAAPSQPTTKEIQTALKNAGFYTGAIDGKMGPKAKKAIADFQKANDLVVDGKVGPKTWKALSKHLNAQAPAVTTTSKTR
jgi:peptidoglycan hydrolase-like protein with peptidoglycan-binding domain